MKPRLQILNDLIFAVILIIYNSSTGILLSYIWQIICLFFSLGWQLKDGGKHTQIWRFRGVLVIRAAAQHLTVRVSRKDHRWNKKKTWVRLFKLWLSLSGNLSQHFYNFSDFLFIMSFYQSQSSSKLSWKASVKKVSLILGHFLNCPSSLLLFFYYAKFFKSIAAVFGILFLKWTNT